MKYILIQYIGQDQYSYDQTLHDHCRKNTIGECRSRLNNLEQHFAAKNITAYSYFIHEHDPDTGTITLIEQNLYKNPLKTRVEINKEAKSRPKQKAVTTDWIDLPRYTVGLAMDDATATTTTRRPRVNMERGVQEAIARDREAAALRERVQQAVNEIQNRQPA